MPLKKVNREIVINTALKIFKEKSYYNTSMEDIASGCGILKGSLYHYFTSKEDLMSICIQEVHNFFKKEVFAIAYNEKHNAVKKMKLLAAKSEDIFIHRETGYIIGNVGVETAFVMPAFAKSIQAFFNDFLDAMTNIFSEKFSKKEAKTLAEISVAEVEGAIMLSRIYGEKRFLKNAHKRIIAKLN